MKKITVMYSAQARETGEQRNEFELNLSEFEIEHCIFEKRSKISNVDGIIFDYGIDCIQITRIINRLEDKSIPMVRIYPTIKGCGVIEHVTVRHTRHDACNYIKDFFQN